MKKNEIDTLPEYFDGYINEVEDIDLYDALTNYSANLLNKENEKLNKIGDAVYAPGKWTVKEIIQHLIDSERIFNYRALRIARNDKTPLPGFEENEYVPESKANKRTVDNLLYELDIVRKSTVILFESFDEVMLKREGKCFNKNISVLAIGFVISGHTIHHIDVIKNKYFPLVIA